MCRASGRKGWVQSVWSEGLGAERLVGGAGCRASGRKGWVQSVWSEELGAKRLAGRAGCRVFCRKGRVQSILPEGPGGPDPVAGSRHRILSEDILHSRQVL